MVKSVSGVAMGIGTMLLGVFSLMTGAKLGIAVTTSELGVGLFPAIIGIALVVCGAIQAWTARSTSDDFEPLTSQQLRTVLIVFGALSAYVFLIEPLGYFLSTMIFIAALTRMFGAKQWWKVAAISLFTALAFTYVFQGWMQMPLPTGIFDLMGVL